MKNFSFFFGLFGINKMADKKMTQGVMISEDLTHKPFGNKFASHLLALVALLLRFFDEGMRNV